MLLVYQRSGIIPPRTFHLSLDKDVSFFAKKCTPAQLPASARLSQEKGYKVREALTLVAVKAASPLRLRGYVISLMLW